MVSERQMIEERYRKKQAEVLALEEKLKAAKIYLTALRDIMGMFGREGAEPDTDSGESKLRPGSSVAQAREIILKHGAPVHLDDLLKELGKEITRGSQASLAGSLAAYVRREEIFTRPAPNTFGLIELGHTGDDDAAEDDEPPAGFGRQPIATTGFTDDLDDDVPF